MSNMKTKKYSAGIAVLLGLAGCAGAADGPGAASPGGGYFTDARYARIVGDQNVIVDRRGPGQVRVAPACEAKAARAEKKAALKAEWAAVATAPWDAPLPASDADDE